jgi:hypothetical protein
MASIILPIILAFGTGLLVLVPNRRIQTPVLLGLSLGCATVIWQHFVRSGSPGAAPILAASAGTGGFTATLIASIGLSGHDGDTAKPALVPWLPREVWRLIGLALLIAIFGGSTGRGLFPLFQAAVLLLAGGALICWLADSLRRATGGLVVLTLGLHLLYLAMVSRVSILEILLLDSLPIVVALVVASFQASLTPLQPASYAWTTIDTDIQEPFL